MGAVHRRAAVVAVLVLVCGVALFAESALAGSPFSWSSPTAIDAPNTLRDVSCPSASMCAAVDEEGNVVTTTNPAGGPWTVSLVDNGPVTPFELYAISCPSTSLCVAGDLGGRILTSTNPTGGVAAWSAPLQIDGTIGINGISCPSANLCVAITEEGNVVTSTNPGAGSPVWTTATLPTLPGDQPHILNAISCASATLCVATDLGGEVLTSTDPTGGAGKWKFTHLVAAGLYGVSCPSTTLCVVVGQQGYVLHATNPTGGAAAWGHAIIDGTNTVYDLSCPSTSLCVATDVLGSVEVSTNPKGGAAAWSAKKVANDFLYGVSCGSRTRCVVTDDNGNAITGTGIAPSPSCVVPKVTGKLLGIAKNAITTRGCSVGRITHATSRTIRRNHVISQKPKAGSRLKHGAKVNLVVSKGP
jgi:hypothetical protein